MSRLKLNIGYILIDYENIQPIDLKNLDDDFFRVKVFLGANQAKISTKLATAMQCLKDRGEYIQISGCGKNALDFHITYYLGKLISTEPEAHYYIISNDTGFDPLITHIKDKKTKISRVKTIGDIPKIKVKHIQILPQRVSFILEQLKIQKNSKPATVATLQNMIKSRFQNTIETKDIESIIEELAKKKHITIHEKKVTYHF